MIQELREEIVSDFKGTIIDIETIGDFNGRYRNTGDWREYEGIQQVIFGYVNSQYLQILWVKQKEEIAELNDRVAKIIDTLEKPFYAFNTAFEKNVLTCQLGSMSSSRAVSPGRKRDAIRTSANWRWP